MDNNKLLKNIQAMKINFLPIAKKKVNNADTFICPLCNNGIGKSGTGICIDTSNNDKIVYKCFKCGVSGDVLDWWMYQLDLKQPGKQPSQEDFIKGLLSCAENYNLDLSAYKTEEDTPKQFYLKAKISPQEAFKNIPLEEDTTQPKQDIWIDTVYNKPTEPDQEGLDYLASRGISFENAFNNKVFPALIKGVSEKGKKYQFKAIIKEHLSKGHNIKSFTPGFDFKGMEKGKGSDISLYYENCKYYDNIVIVCEGMFDALTVSELGIKAISLNTITNKQKLYNYLVSNRGYFKDKTIIISLDNDKPGLDKEIEYKTFLNSLNMDIRFINDRLYLNFELNPEYKDLNAFYLKEKETGLLQIRLFSLLKEIKTEIKEYNPYTFLYWWNNQREQEKLLDIRYKTGFTRLDSLLGGGLPVGLTCLGAISSIGKTTFLTQIAENLASQKINVLYFSLEQKPKKLFEKGLLRNLYFSGNIGTDRENKNNVETYNNKVGGYYNIIKNDGKISVSVIDRLIQEIKSYNQNQIIVIIDFLQLLQPEDITGKITDRLEGRQKVDNILTALRDLSDNYTIPIIAVSSLNRTSYFSVLDMDSFKESGNIEYQADLVLGMDYKDVKELDNKLFSDKKLQDHIRKAIKENKAKPEKIVTLSIIKNREGEVGGETDFMFKAKYQVFEELTQEEE